MTTAQWIFEMRALEARDRAQVDLITSAFQAGVSSLKTLMVGLLGLRWGTEKDEAGEPMWVPLSHIVGRPEMLKTMFEAQEKSERVDDAVGDEAFDAWSSQLAKGDLGDLGPILENMPDISDPVHLWNTPEIQETMRAMGVRIYNKEEEAKEEAADG